MAPRIAPLRPSPILFAHRGSRSTHDENTMPAFQAALALGATGLESDVWLTRDRVAVLDHDGVVRRLGVLKTPFAEIDRADLPTHVPDLADLLSLGGGLVEVSLDVKSEPVLEAIVRTATAVEDELGRPVLPHLWICHHDVDLLGDAVERFPEARFVNSIRKKRIEEPLERRAATLAERGIAAMNMHYSDWTGGLTTLFHRFEVEAFAWDAQLVRVIHDLLEMGVDAVYGDDVTHLVDTARHVLE